ncbi:MAG: PAS domain-containing sensor histidine kinase [Vicinamibacterales bacterium]
MPLVGSSFWETARTSGDGMEIAAPPPLPAPSPTTRHVIRTLAFACLLVAGLVALEWYSQLTYSLGIFYVFPILVAGTVLSRPQILAAACICALVRGQFTPELTPIEFWLRFAMATLAYAGIGLLVVEMTQRRRRVFEAYERLQVEQTRRYQAEDRLRLLAESSPAAIVTLNDRAEVIGANQAAAEVLGYDSAGDLAGRSLADQVPIFLSALRKSPGGRPMRTSATSWARRANGQIFPITVWFSTYGDGQARCLAGILVDTSEEVRDREREAFRHFLDYNRLLAGAVAHEIRNLCSAIRVTSANLGHRVHLHEDVDFRALRTLVDGLARIAAFELETGMEPTVHSVDLHQIFDQLRVVIEPDWVDMEGTIAWELEDATLRVPADAHALLQVFLNLAQNSLRASQGCARPALRIRAWQDGSSVIVSVADEGRGMRDAGQLFQPFRENADGSGLGLYISRTLVRTFGGDLRYVPQAAGCRFDVILPCEPSDRDTP